jgi:hypothetical protein
MRPGQTTAALVAVTALLGATSSAAAAHRPTAIPGIRSPSGNIRCLVVPHAAAAPGLFCSIGHATYSAALQHRCSAPPTGLDWHGFELPAATKGAVSCSGGILYDPATQRPAYRTLPYGQSWGRGPFACTSRIAGMTCSNRAGHGLFVSRERWRAW